MALRGLGCAEMDLEQLLLKVLCSPWAGCSQVSPEAQREAV